MYDEEDNVDTPANSLVNLPLSEVGTAIRNLVEKRNILMKERQEQIDAAMQQVRFHQEEAVRIHNEALRLQAEGNMEIASINGQIIVWQSLLKPTDHIN